VANADVATTTYAYDANGNVTQAGGWSYSIPNGPGHPDSLGQVSFRPHADGISNLPYSNKDDWPAIAWASCVVLANEQDASMKTNWPPLGATPQLTVLKILRHPDENHHRLFNLQIDGVTVKSNVNSGGTDPQHVSPESGFAAKAASSSGAAQALSRCGIT
jgi:hypothetical protein